MSHEWNYTVYIRFLTGMSFCTILYRFIQVVVCINNLFLFIAWIVVHSMDVLQLFINLLKDIWVISSLGLLQIKLLWTLVYKFLCNPTFLFLWDKWPRVQLLGHIIFICLQNLPNCSMRFSLLSFYFTEQGFGVRSKHFLPSSIFQRFSPIYFFKAL